MNQQTTRIVMTLFGMALLGLAVGMLKTADFGTDPFTVFMMGLWSFTNRTLAALTATGTLTNTGAATAAAALTNTATTTQIDYGLFAMLVNIALLIIMFFLNRPKIGIGTFINLFFLGYLIQFSWELVSKVFPTPTIPTRIILFALAILILCFASSLYFVADLGISTYDVYAVTLGERTKIPFKFWRILTDSICVAIGFSFGETVGIGTLVTALFMGPLITFFADRVARPMLGEPSL